jgi:hypothetical protein
MRTFNQFMEGMTTEGWWGKSAEEIQREKDAADREKDLQQWRANMKAKSAAALKEPIKASMTAHNTKMKTMNDKFAAEMGPEFMKKHGHLL